MATDCEVDKHDSPLTYLGLEIIDQAPLPVSYKSSYCWSTLKTSEWGAHVSLGKTATRALPYPQHHATLADVDTAIFSISQNSLFDVNSYARSAIATSSIASGLDRPQSQMPCFGNSNGAFDLDIYLNSGRKEHGPGRSRNEELAAGSVMAPAKSLGKVAAGANFAGKLKVEIIEQKKIEENGEGGFYSTFYRQELLLCWTTKQLPDVHSLTSSSPSQHMSQVSGCKFISAPSLIFFPGLVAFDTWPEVVVGGWESEQVETDLIALALLHAGQLD
ncbi:uncharacterized protein LACBIDRAFT_326651 [Laccaria bicolor S238N-H82]|uniref:Predicted protein n=1 Tax=Laccaria bicolor (strain S238N-H82 / ATCC MYA-4686) TaxID=486041 RepID=B0D9C5_LACBS|nr:uncharacterized protein LACBIDRAFT_326651 [Laccaria bicolor S238N-H82]EDR09223.1 predicted protein [Laccaria bicolor S238N-H82]|eukprot:XP_001880536.1 predicted protein [Laccaria bicolor S238N-H82]